jgi:hypothetical protein
VVRRRAWLLLQAAGLAPPTGDQAAGLAPPAGQQGRQRGIGKGEGRGQREVGEGEGRWQRGMGSHLDGGDPPVVVDADPGGRRRPERAPAAEQSESASIGARARSPTAERDRAKVRAESSGGKWEEEERTRPAKQYFPKCQLCVAHYVLYAPRIFDT